MTPSGNRDFVPTDEEDTIKTVDAATFVDEGYLIELNRTFLHPLGLALSYEKKADGTRILWEVWDYRECPEGMVFAEIDEADVAKIENVQRIQAERAPARSNRYGWIRQPATPHVMPEETT